AMPQLRIQYRGRAFMGISGDDRPVGCRVRQLQAGSPAEQAKVLPGDVIIQFDGKPIRDFNEMIKHIAEKQPNDVVKLEILRGDENDLQALERLQALKDPGPDKELLDELRKRLTKEVEVTLGEWK
ncbi:MAG TPA: PDZ domain-containing protein, partial [Planctomycetaceae bacterium]|nr:PDZ domain-containing protein [Planctomycetaceae bacterium]